MNSTYKGSKFLEGVREVIRIHHFSYRTEKIYIHWIYRFIIYHDKKHPKEMGASEISAFLTHLAVERKVSVSTQNQALNALIFLYKKVLKFSPGVIDFTSARKGKRLPVVFSREEAIGVISNLQGEFQLMASILYGSGLRHTECLNLRIKDFDFQLNEIMVRGGKGDNDRRTILPTSLLPELRRQMEKTRIQFEENKSIRGFSGTSIPASLERKYPGAPKELGWQFIFPSRKPAIDPYTGSLRQHHRHESFLQKEVKKAIRKAGILKNASCHTFRHSFATHLIEDGYDIRTVQELLGHKDVRSTMVYTHVLQKNQYNVQSPLDQMNRSAR